MTTLLRWDPFKTRWHPLKDREELDSRLAENIVRIPFSLFRLSFSEPIS